MAKYVYSFGPLGTDGDASMRNLLGGKGANLAEMAKIGLPVPSGFTITTEGFTKDISCTVTSNDMNGVYAYERQDMNIFWKGPSYDARTGTFYVNDCDFYLEKLLK